HALGIPSTRALAVVATGEWVARDRALPGAILTRVAHSHLRVGTFQYFAARGDEAGLQRLLDYTVQRHRPAPECFEDAKGDTALALLMAVLQRQAQLVAQWMGVGFIHGVMNTDNMSLSGQSIDFGPCAFMEAHDPGTVYSSIDHHGRYAYGRQPGIAQWNLARLAEALLPVMQGPQEQRVEAAIPVIESFGAAFDAAIAAVWRRKLGWPDAAEPAVVRAFAQDWQALLQAHQVDHTLGWHGLLDAAKGDLQSLMDRFGEGAAAAQHWLQRWQAQARAAGWAIELATLKQANPAMVPRNHLVEGALQAASDDGDLQPFHALLHAVRQPWSDDPALRPYAQAAPPEVAAAHRTFCGT
ncbi:MAG: protein adenylyltransferase SelO family protein, partial [Betaproteobacteria bacterium]